MKSYQKFLGVGVMLVSLLGVSDIAKANPKNDQVKIQHVKSQDSLKEEAKYFDNNQISSLRIFSKDKLINEKSWDIEGKQKIEIDYVYSNDGTYTKISYTTGQLRKYIKDKCRYKGDPEGKNVILERWIYDREKNYCLVHKNKYREGTRIVEERYTYDPKGELDRTYIFSYVPGKEKWRRIKGFEAYDAKGEKVGSYDEEVDLNIEEIISGKDADPEQIEKWLKVYNDTNRIPTVIIDTGFDIKHDLITHKLWKNPKEILNGIDDDGDGFIDNVIGGWYLDKSKGFGINSPNINERLVLDATANLYRNTPFSHGAHVASVALKDLEKFALVGFAGDVSNPDYLKKINSFIKQNNIRFVNMSFTFWNPKSPFAPNRESFDEMERMIQENPETLFFIAAGNKERDLDSNPNYRSYPASLPYENIIVVGALDAPNIIEDELPNYKVAKLSNIGNETVDFFAPGNRIPGALIGGGTKRIGGTSTSGPYAYNIALKMYSKNPMLSGRDIKRILLKTVYINPKGPLTCVSKGIIHPKRAQDVASLLAKNPSISLEDAIQQIIILQ